MQIHVKLPCHDLVDGIERRPNVDAVAQAVEELYRKGAEIAGLEFRLAFCKLHNHDVTVALEFFVARAGERKRASRQIMPAREVTPQFTIGLFPITQWLCRSGQPRCQAKSMEQPVGRQRLQVAAVGFRCGAERARSQPDVAHTKGNRLQGHNIAALCQCSGRYGRTGILILKCERRCTKNSTGAGDSGGGDERATADLMRHRILDCEQTIWIWIMLTIKAWDTGAT